MKKTIIALATGCMLSSALLASPAHAWGNNNSNYVNYGGNYSANSGWRGTVNRISNGFGFNNGAYANWNNNNGNWNNNNGYNCGRPGIIGRILHRIF